MENGSLEWKNLKVLVVDDNHVVFRLFQKFLQQLGVSPGNISFASNAEEALEIFRSARAEIHVVICDKTLSPPGFDFTGLGDEVPSKGIEFFRQIQGERQGIKGILTTGYELSPEEKNDMLQLGFSGFYSKQGKDFDSFKTALGECLAHEDKPFDNTQAFSPPEPSAVFAGAEERARRHLEHHIANYSEAFRELATRALEDHSDPMGGAANPFTKEKVAGLKKPYQRVHPNPSDVFLESSENVFRYTQLLSLSDWQVDRGVAKAEKLWGIHDFPGLAAAVAGFCGPEHPGGKPVVLCLGPGDGQIMVDLKNDQVTAGMEHVGLANAWFIAPERFLGCALLPQKDESVAAGLKCFIADLSTILFNEYGLGGLLTVELGNMLDENQIREFLLSLPKEKPLKMYAEGKKRVFRAREFPKDTPGYVSEAARPYFAHYINDPVGFLRQYFAPTLSSMEVMDKGKIVDEQEAKIMEILPDIPAYFITPVRRLVHRANCRDGKDYFFGQGDQKAEEAIKLAYASLLDSIEKDVSQTPNLRALLHHHQPHGVQEAHFRALNDAIPGNSSRFVMAHESRAFSHLHDSVFQKAVNEILIRLRPGGVFVLDGVNESYTRHIRINELRNLEIFFGDEYKFSIVGDPQEQEVRSVIIRRGKNVRDEWDFLPADEIKRHLHEGMKFISLFSFESVYSRAAFRDLIVKKVKWGLFQEMLREIAEGKEEGNLYNVWRIRKFGGMQEIINALMAAFFKHGFDATSLFANLQITSRLANHLRLQRKQEIVSGIPSSSLPEQYKDAPPLALLVRELNKRLKKIRANLLSALSMAEKQLVHLEDHIRAKHHDENLDIDLLEGDNPSCIAFFHQLKDSIIHARHYTTCETLGDVQKASADAASLLESEIPEKILEELNANRYTLSSLADSVRAFQEAPPDAAGSPDLYQMSFDDCFISPSSPPKKSESGEEDDDDGGPGKN
ncbi:response regulator [Candidatus Peregrinibacteria bacterium]|nr:response regulator [Candidatus Peregrinibacteria bacterium]